MRSMSDAERTPRCSRFEGRRAVVTGGAGNIGRAIVRRLRDEGAEVAIVDRDGGLLAEAVDELGPGGGVHGFPADVTVDVETTLDAVTARLGSWDVLVGAVGVIPKCSWRATDEATWARTIEVNLTSAFRWTAAACRRWIDDPVDGQAPAIVHVVSVEATVAFPQQVAYAASKAGLAGLIRAMAVDLADAGIRICGVAPGTVPNHRAGPAPDWGSYTARIPLGRLGRPADVAGAVAYLASEDAAYVTGEILYVDGGFVVA
jgi:NAD(P)-dependent dehydrogenase (short-subunit alcohol dehydrogenase family)